MSLPCYSPKQIEELKRILEDENENLSFLAGGTDLMIQLAEKIIEPSLLINLSEIAKLKNIYEEKDNIIIGSMVTHTQITQSNLLRKYTPALIDACSQIGSSQIRNRATIGGNVANASPAGDSIPALYVHQAKVRLLRTDGVIREVPIEEFFIAPGKTIREPKEIIIEFVLSKNIERNIKNNIGFFRKLGVRKALIISKVSISFNSYYDKHTEKLDNVYIALGAVAPTVIRAPKTEEYLTDKLLTISIIEEASKLLTEEAHPISDVRSTADYRRKMVGVLLKQGLENLKH